MSSVQGYATWGVQPDSETRRCSGGAQPQPSLQAAIGPAALFTNTYAAATTETYLRYGNMGILGSRFWHHRHACWILPNILSTFRRLVIFSDLILAIHQRWT
jgi:hypothetical protein